MPNVEKRYKFNGRRYNSWVDKMKFLLMSVNVFYVLDPNLDPIPEDPVGENVDEKVIADLGKQRMLRKKDEALCYKYIINSLSDSLRDLYTLRSNNDPRLLWKALEDDFKATKIVQNKQLVKMFLDFRMVDGKPMMDQVFQLQGIVNLLKENSIIIPKLFYIAAIINKLPPSWKDFALTMKMSKNDNLTLGDLHKQIDIEESARKRNKKRIITAPKRMNKNTKTGLRDDGPLKKGQLGVKKPNNNFKKLAPCCNVRTDAINAAQLADLMALTNLIGYR